MGGTLLGGVPVLIRLGLKVKRFKTATSNTFCTEFQDMNQLVEVNEYNMLVYTRLKEYKDIWHHATHQGPQDECHNKKRKNVL